ncbi:MAG: TonB-dependent receptor domain-containing protein, partial [Oceanococcaceae bacterium]
MPPPSGLRAQCLWLAAFSCTLPAYADSNRQDYPEPHPGIALPAEPMPADSAHSSVELHPITVVATGNARTVAEVPQAVEILDRDQIERSQSTDLAELLDRVPGVELMGGPRPDAENLVIRGLGGLAGTRVVLLVDGAHQNLDRGVLSRLNVDPALLKSVEVLKGPASMLYGSGAIAGVVSLTTKDASDLLNEGSGDKNWGLRLRGGYHSADEGWEAGGSAFTALGALDLLADVQWRQSEDFRQGGGSTMPYSGRDSHSNLAKLGWNFDDGSVLRLSSTGFQAEGLSLGNPTQPVTDTNSLRYREQDQRFSALAYEAEPSWGPWNRLRLALDHSDYQTSEQTVSSASNAGPLSALGLGETGLPVGALDALLNSLISATETSEEEPEPPRQYDYNTIGGDFALGFGWPLWDQQLTIGGEYHQDEGRARQGDAPINNFPDAEQTNYGIYVQEEFRPWPGLNVVGGVRYDRYQSRPGQNIEAEEVDEDAISPQLGATWDLGAGLSLAALYGEAFRAPSLRESYSFGQHFLDNEFVINPDLKPERAANKELSLRFHGQPFGLDHLGASLTVFQNDIRDFMELIVTVEVEGPVPPAPQCLP